MSLILSLTLAAFASGPLPALAEPPAAGTSRIKLAWKYKNLPPTMSVYSLRPGAKPAVWLTGVGKSLEELPVGGELRDSELVMAPGSSLLFVLVYKNPTKETLRFFVPVHRVAHEELSLGFKFKCLCINHVFSVPPGRYWYRVVKMTLMPQFSAPALKVTHTLVRVAP